MNRCKSCGEIIQKRGGYWWHELITVRHIPEPMALKDRITIEPNKRGGQPCVRGLRITVHEVLEYLASDMTEAQILVDFPDLEPEDFEACRAYGEANPKH
jgi:uncharacterized protein (DUF433 family)